MSSYLFIQFMEQKRNNINRMKTQNRFYTSPALLNARMKSEKNREMKRYEKTVEDRLKTMEDQHKIQGKLYDDQILERKKDETQSKNGCILM